ncbi:MAG: excinuclease ABC subunit UvrA [Thermodesulfobacteriota bacterium]
MSFIKKVLPALADDVPIRDCLAVEGLRENNLKDLSISIPHERITAVVGPSGSGKSSLAFDTLFAEGRWRFMESLSTYTRLFLDKMERPDVDAIHNIRPAIAVEQKNPVRTNRSTVGTTSEINDYLRLIFARIGKLHCQECMVEITPEEPSTVAESLISGSAGLWATIGFTVEADGKAEEVMDGLLARGFSRIRHRAKIYNLGEKRPRLTSLKDLDVVMDRVRLAPPARERLTGSIENAYREGGDEVWVAVEGKRLMRFTRALRCSECGTLTKRPTPIALSFNHPVGACTECRGFGNILLYDEDKIIPDRNLSLREGAIAPWTKPSYQWLYEELEEAAPLYGIDLEKPYEELSVDTERLIFDGTEDFHGVNEFFAGLEKKKYRLHIKVFTSRYKSFSICNTCSGSRLNSHALNLTIEGKNIAEVCAMSIEEAKDFFDSLDLGETEKKISGEALAQIRAKLEFLSETGLGYISISRPTKTLSGGEIQRVSLATQLASSLTGVLYVLDEPSVGLHPVDIEALKAQMKKLCSRGNTIVVVEHDAELIRNSHYIVELGPGAGEMGGRAVFTGETEDFIREAQTLTARYLTGISSIKVPHWRRRGSGKTISLKGARGNNLKDVNISIPLKTLTCVTGVSGSGKSTLIIETLYRALARSFQIKAEQPLPFTSMHGGGNIGGLQLVDQAPIGRTQRSIPVTYIGAFDGIRKLLANESLARASGFSAGHFSFNVPGGRCEACRGEGSVKLEMYFLPDIYIKCGKCEGRRFSRSTLAIKYRGLNVSDILQLTFDEASRVLLANKDLQRRLKVMADVGLGYLRLGQPAPTLSGGEAQRIKIARELLRGEAEDTLYILDEPTTGLHTDDIKRLLNLLGRLVDNGNTVLLIEHNMEVIKTADHVIDLGPGSGPLGGSIVSSGPPEAVAKSPAGVTAPFLKKVLGL